MTRHRSRVIAGTFSNYRSDDDEYAGVAPHRVRIGHAAARAVRAAPIPKTWRISAAAVMADLDEKNPSVQDSLQQVMALLRKHELLADLMQRQVVPRRELVEKQVH